MFDDSYRYFFSILLSRNAAQKLRRDEFFAACGSDKEEREIESEKRKGSKASAT